MTQKLTRKNYIDMSIKSYSELINIPDFVDRIRYLKLSGKVTEMTFGFQRYLNQQFYKSQRWKDVRNFVILRDNGCDLAMPGYELNRDILIHHLNPITVDDIRLQTDALLSPENLVCVSHATHNIIHYGDESYINDLRYIERSKNDTCPWRN